MKSLMGDQDGDALTLYEHGATLLELGRYTDAAIWLVRAADTARARHDSSLAKGIELAAVRALLAAGQSAQARRRFQAAQAQWDEVERNRSPQHVEFLRTQALLSAHAGELAEAMVLLAQAAQAATARSGPEHPDRLALELTQGEVALTASDFPAALAHAGQAGAAARRAALDPQRSSGVGQALWLQARAEAALQQPTAEATAGAALAQLEPMWDPGIHSRKLPGWPQSRAEHSDRRHTVPAASTRLPGLRRADGPDGHCANRPEERRSVALAPAHGKNPLGRRTSD